MNTTFPKGAVITNGNNIIAIYNGDCGDNYFWSTEVYLVDGEVNRFYVNGITKMDGDWRLATAFEVNLIREALKKAISVI